MLATFSVVARWSVTLPSVNVFSAADAARARRHVKLLPEVMEHFILDRRELGVRDRACKRRRPRCA